MISARLHAPHVLHVALAASLALAAAVIAPGCTSHSADDDGGPVADSGARDAAIDPALLEAVDDYLTADKLPAKPKLLDQLGSTYRDVPFDTLERAVRWRPPSPKFPATGKHQGSWTNPLAKIKAEYNAYVPPALAKSKRDRFPLIVYLHGAGGNGTEIFGDPTIVKAADQHGAILVAPTSASVCDWSLSEGCMSQVVLLVQMLKRRYPVDDARVVLTGFSMGGRGAFSVGVAYPEPYCGVIPGAGTIGAAYDDPDLEKHRTYCCPLLENAFNLRLQYISGDRDVPRLVYQNRGCDRCPASPLRRYTEVPGGGHQFFPKRWADAVSWTLSRPRPAYPKSIRYNLTPQLSGTIPGGLWVQRKLKVPQYWAVITEQRDTAKPSRLAARVASKSRIELTATNVARVEIYLADELVDLHRTVTIVSGSDTLYSGKVARDRRLLLTEARRRSERAMTFAARLRLKIPGS